MCVWGRGCRWLGAPPLPDSPHSIVCWPPSQEIAIAGGLTFFTALSLVARVADAGAHDTCTMVAAGHINALVGGHITLSALPATVAQAPALHVLAIPAAEHRTGGCGDSIRSLV